MTFSLTDIATMLGIVVTSAGIIAWFLKVVVSDPLKNSLDRLSREIYDFKGSTAREHDKFVEIDEDHERRISSLERSEVRQDSIIDLEIGRATQKGGDEK